MELNPVEFDWDQWNMQKNEVKHGVSQEEAESIFSDPRHCLFRDEKHSTSAEGRFILLGKSAKSRVLMTAFTIRRSKIRIITVRPASQQERKIYEEEKQK